MQPEGAFFFQNFQIAVAGEFSKNRSNFFRREGQNICKFLRTQTAVFEGVQERAGELVLPDSDGIANAQIGNLIPLEDALNRSCANKSLTAKCDFYEKSSFTSARGIATRFREKPFDPSKRTEYLAKLMYNNILELNQFDYSKD